MTRLISTQTFRYPNRVFESPAQAEEFEGQLQTVVFYDENGNILRQENYDVYGNLENITEYRYNEQNKLAEELLYYEECELAERLILEYNDKGSICRTIKEYQEGGKIFTEYVYNEHGQLTEKIEKNDDDEIEEKNKYEYEGEYLILKQKTNSDNELLHELRLSYNENGKIIEEVIRDFENPDESRRTENRYNDDGLIEKQFVFDANDEPIEKSTFIYDVDKRLVEIHEESRKNGIRKIYFTYNEQGTPVKQEMFNAAGQLIYSSSDFYDKFQNKIMNTVYYPNDETGFNPSYSLVYVHEYSEE